MKIVKKVLVIAMVVCIAVTFMPAESALAMNAATETKIKTKQSAATETKIKTKQSAATGAKIKTNQSAGVGQSTESTVKKIMDNMSLREKITQCMMIDFRMWENAAGEIENMTMLKSEVAELLADYKFGSLIMFAENFEKPAQTVKLTKDIQTAAMKKGGLPMLVATDQEGGRVARMAGATSLPGNMALCATDNPKNAETAGNIIGRELKAAGLNTTLAPVLDVNNNPANPVIGFRSFSDDPKIVGKYGDRFIAGLNKYNIIGCAKHFPGHGDTNVDSHYGLPTVNKTLPELRKIELKPFGSAIKNNIEMIMTAHILYPKVDDSKIHSEKTGKEESRPATMSHKILTGLLRGEMGYKGVIITDAMNMQGLADNFTMEQATVESMKAGADILCMPVSDVYDKQEWKTRMDSIIAAIETTAESDKDFAASLDESVARILTMKKNKGILNYKASDYSKDKAVSELRSKKNRSLERKISAKAMTVVRNKKHTLPLRPTKKSRILLLTPYEDQKAQLLMGLNRARAAGMVPKETRAWADTYIEGDGKIQGELKKQLKWATIVLVVTQVGNNEMDYSNWLSSGPKAYAEYCRKNGKKSVILSSGIPYDAQLYPTADAVMVLYGYKGSEITGMPQLVYGKMTETRDTCGPNIVAAAEVAFGVFGASGKLPVNIPVYDAKSKEYTSKLAYKRGFGISYKKLKPVAKLKKAAIRSVKTGKRRMKVTMTTAPKGKGGTHYQVAYKIKGKKKWSSENTAKKSVTITKLKAKKRYIIKARVFKKVNGRKHYGAWSRTRKI